MPTLHEQRETLLALKRDLERDLGGTMSDVGVVTITGAQIQADGTSWIEVIPTVEKARNGEWFFTITTADLETLAADVAAKPDRISVDYDHATQEKGDSRAAGWFTGEAVVVRAGEDGPTGETQDHDSAWARVKWTPKAVKEIRDGEFRFVSAEWSMKARDKATGLMTRFKELVAATLTNRPFFKGLAAVTAAELAPEQVEAITEEHGADIASLVAAAAQSEDEDLTAAAAQILAAIDAAKAAGGEPSATDQGGNHDNEGVPVSDETQVTDYMKMLGLDETVDPKHRLAAAFREKDEKILALETKVTELTAASGKKDVKTEELTARVGELEQRDRERDIAVVLRSAVSSGRILPAEKDTLNELFAKDVTGLKRLIATRPENFVGVGDPKGVGGDADRFIDDPDVSQYTASLKSVDPVDTESAKLHLQALQILKDKGKSDTYTNDEYIDACAEASKQLVY